jgi:hypothetical protein
VSAARRPAACIVLGAVAILLAACSSDGDDGTEVERARACNLYMRDQGVSVRLAGAGAGRACREWLADEGWSRGAGGDADTSFERVCVVFRSGTGAALYATGKRGSQGEAAGVCDSLVSEGWSGLKPPNGKTSGRRPAPEPSRFDPVRCAEGRCFQGGGEVAQPTEGAVCGEGAWTYVGISRDGQAGVYRCLTDPDPTTAVTCDSYVERCTQGRWAVRQPEPGAACGEGGGRRWEEAATSDAVRVYRCAPASG